MKSRLLLALLLFASCSRPAPERAAKAKEPGELPTDIINEQSSLLDLSRGATIVSRTGETMLPVSAVSTIDGDVGTFWQTPPHDFPQSIVIALGAPSRIDRIGIRSLEVGFEPKSVPFESSLDGTTWQPLATITPKRSELAQWLDVTPTTALYLRVNIPAPTTEGHDVRLHSIYARGAEIAPRVDPPIDGCWSINGSASLFVQRGIHATGVLMRGAQPIFLEGGSTGRVWRFNWIHGNDFGCAALAVSPDGKHFSGIEWHEEAIPLFRGMPWFGERTTCTPFVMRNDVELALLHRSNRVALFGLQFDASGNLLRDPSREELQSLLKIIRAAPPIDIIAHEFRQPDARRNKEVAQHEIDSVKAALVSLGADMSRISFRAAGSDDPRQKPESDIARVVYSSVEVEVRR
ncbi:MAG TPA: discoidin domain-containing protein [Thermoanaerobaculia bacterium]|nr:discoidin domain-containing protein [Thermoanaerobaculia bacterium]